ncbi:MAG TPA: hypothetical protein VEG30_01355 [Terriglobales bacterium]|nr:hypothetical protein [Terriglobales bacterium]
MNTPTTNYRVRINPGKFWAATKSMSQEEADNLLEAIFRMAQEGDINGLIQFGFIYLETAPVEES